MAQCATITNGLNANSCTVNPGGVVTLYLANYDDITALGLTGATGTQTPLGSIINVITGPGGTGATAPFIYEYQLPKNTASVTEEAQYNNDTLTGFLQTVNFQMNGFSTEKRDAIMQLSKALVVAFCKMVNGDIWAYGTENGLNMTAMSDTSGVARADLQTYTITLTETQATMKYIVDPNVSNGGAITGGFDNLVVED